MPTESGRSDNAIDLPRFAAAVRLCRALILKVHTANVRRTGSKSNELVHLRVRLWHEKGKATSLRRSLPTALIDVLDFGHPVGLDFQVKETTTNCAHAGRARFPLGGCDGFDTPAFQFTSPRLKDAST
jgi:hypothetical protein